MLDRTYYELSTQSFCLYCRGKENGLKILDSIDNNQLQLGLTIDTISTTTDGGVTLGMERPRTYHDLNDSEKKIYDANIITTNIVLQGLPNDITNSSITTLKPMQYETLSRCCWLG